MDTYISHSRWRREKWKGHVSAKGVRQAIAYDRGLNHLTIFRRSFDVITSSLILVQVPREDWDAEFAD